MDRAVLDTALDRAPVNDDGRSGATLERVLLADGSRVVVKRFDPSVDLVMRLSGDTRGREVDFFRRGILDRLPATVLHPVIDGWYDDDGLGVLVMRDLGDAVLNWKSVVTREQARTMFGAVADLHAAFLGSAPDGLTPLGSVQGLFEPQRIRPLRRRRPSWTTRCAGGSTGRRSRRARWASGCSPWLRTPRPSRRPAWPCRRPCCTATSRP